ncbi:hypothetical protein Tco_0648528 [Tanacetum coccineum]
MGCCVLGPEIIAHSIEMTLLLRNITVPPSTGNFNIPCAVDVECFSSPIFTSRDIWPSGQMVSPLNPMSDAVAGTIWLFISGRSLTKQCLYRTSEDAPPSTYIRCTKCPPISASMIIGPSVPSSSPKDGKEITVSEEKLWVTLCLATLSHGTSAHMYVSIKVLVDLSPSLCMIWLSMDSFGSLSNQTLAFPVSIELNIWHHVGHLSVFIADWKSFKWSFGSPLPSYVLTWLGILVFGKSKCRIRVSVTSLAVFTLRISVVFSGQCAPVMMLPWLHFGSLRMGTLVAAVRTCICALFFPPNLLNTSPSFRGLGPGEGGLFRLSLLKTLAIGDGIRAVGVLDSE